jgi:hypothetical protein
MKITGYPVSAKHPHVALAIRYKLVDEKPSRFVDHWIDGMRRHFDMSQWHALDGLVREKIKAAMRAGGMPGKSETASASAQPAGDAPAASPPV